MYKKCDTCYVHGFYVEEDIPETCECGGKIIPLTLEEELEKIRIIAGMFSYIKK